jgi:hypothetical protein
MRQEDAGAVIRSFALDARGENPYFTVAPHQESTVRASAFTPKCISIIVCEMVLESITGLQSAINIFDTLSASVFPAARHNMYVLVSLTNGRGIAQFSLRFVQDDGTALIELHYTHPFSSPLDVVNLKFEFKEVPIPEAGNYAVQFLSDGTMIGERRIKVVPQSST